LGYDFSMMNEVHTGTRPGRPALLIVLCALSLAGTVGLAWLQVGESRALAAEERVGESPLIVRPPKGWVRHPSEPGTFVEAVELEGQPGVHVERRISFHYQRWSRMQSIVNLLRYRNQRELVSRVSDLEPARVAGLDGVQVRRARSFRFLGRDESGGSVYRLAISPRGDEINVEYIPVRELTPGDFDLLEAICAAVRIDDPALHVSAAEAKRQTGVDFALEAGWRIHGADYPGVPSLFVQGGDRGVPLWAVGVFRTWLAKERQPVDLVRDLAMTDWLMPPDALEIEATRAGAREIASAVQPPGLPSGAAGSLVTAAHVVSESADKTVMLVAYADPSYSAEAREAAASIADSLTFSDLRFPASINEAAELGQRLAEGLAVSAEPWGTEPSTLYYRAEYVGPPDYRTASGLQVQGRVASPDLPREYQGVDQIVTAEGASDLQWRLLTGGGYEWRRDYRLGARPRRVEESRSAAKAPIRRVISLPRQRREYSVSPGAGFVSGPLESLAEAQVARQARGEWLVSASTTLGAACHSRLLVPLPHDEAGLHRVLLLDDYQPRPAALTFDAAGELMSRQEPGTVLRRISAMQAEILQRRLSR
jgi:hypothetical protein